MRIHGIGGGLGNQILHYIFYRYGERRQPDELWLLDDSSIYGGSKFNGYELERVFSVKPNLVSNYFGHEVGSELMRQGRRAGGLCQAFYQCGLPFLVVDDIDTPAINYKGPTVQASCIGSGDRLLEILNLPVKNIYYHGNMFEENWFLSYKAENRAELTFPPLSSDRNLRYADMIRSSFSVGIHVRRGDFVQLGLDVPIEIYREGCEKAVERYPNAQFFVFSNDLEWCQANAEALGFHLAANTTYMAGNTGYDSYIDMQLLSMCKGIIRLGGSTFSLLAAWLNAGLQFEILLWKDKVEGFDVFDGYAKTKRQIWRDN